MITSWLSSLRKTKYIKAAGISYGYASMTAEGHLFFSVACAIFAKKAGITPELAQGDWWHIIPGALLTSLLPDIDHPGSIIGQKLKWFSVPVARVFGHRGFTHSLLAVVAGILLMQAQFHPGFIPVDVFHAMLIGYLSHLVADMLTPAGIPLFWPCRWRFRVPLLNSQKGNQLERLLCLFLIGCAVYWDKSIAIPVPSYINQLIILN